MKNFAIRFTYLDDAVWIAVLFAAAAGVSFLLYRRSFRGRFALLPLLLAALRFAAIAAALVLLLRPVVTYDRIRRSEGRVAVLIDCSRSMGVDDSVLGQSRLQSAVRIAASEAVERLADLFRLKRYTFSGPGTLAEYRSAGTRESPGVLAADGETTDLASAWRSIPPGAGNLEAIVLLSDGRDHGVLGAGDEMAPEILPPAPVHAIGLGSGGRRLRDAGWIRLDAGRKALVGNRVSVSGKIRLAGTPRLKATLRTLLDGKEVDRREIDLREGSNDVRWDIVPRRGGTLIYETVLDTGRTPGADTIGGNNKAHFVVEATERQIQVLCLEGRARWQYKFLRRALQTDPSLNVTSLVRLGGGRRLQQGRPPVKLAGDLPSTRQAWKAFDVLLLGNIVAEELPPDSIERIGAWVRREGGGVLFTGGRESLPDLAASPLADLLPVQPGAMERIQGDLLVRQPVTALDHPLTRGLGRFFSPGHSGGPFVLADVFRAKGLRPGSEVVLLAARGKERSVLLAARQCEAGRTIAWLTDSDWRWVMERRSEGGDRLFATLWGRMVRWLARREEPRSSGPRIRLSRRVVRAGEEVRVEVEGSPSPESLRVSVELPGGKRRELTRDAPGGPEAGAGWTARYTPGEEGRHTVRIDGSDAPPAELAVEPDVRELEQLEPDWDLLRRAAAATGGRFLTLPEVGTLADGIVKHSPRSVTHVELGFDRSWILYLALVALLAAEWLLRRKVHVV